jgi:hypothetical protein
MDPPSCEIKLSPTSLDWGEVLPGTAATKQVLVRNVGGAECTLSNIGLDAWTDAWFAASSPTSTVIQPGASAVLAVAFQPAKATTPLTRTGVLTFDVDSPRTGFVAVPLTAKIQSDCKLGVAPAALDFGHVALDDTLSKSVRLTNTGTGPCEVADVAISATSDAQFHVDPASPREFALEPGGEQVLSVSFSPVDPAQPHHRTGNLVFASNDKATPKGTVPLSADIDIGCNLSWQPASVDFGKVRLNTKANRSVSLANDGSDTCYVSGIAITPDSDPNFGITSPPGVAVAPGATASIDLVFSAADSSPPHLKTGTLAFATGNKRAPTARIPLSATVDTVCVEASRWIYTVDQANQLSRFDPSTLTFTDIAVLQCPVSQGPNSMAVDQNAVAWVAYNDGNLCRVDTSTGSCQATSFKSTNKTDIQKFGMGFVFDPSTGRDTLYIAGNADLVGSQSTLATVSFPELLVAPIGTVSAGMPEMTGTGDGQLWGFAPSQASSVKIATLFRIDPNSGRTLESYTYPSLSGGSSWAMKFWGGYFWLFLDNSVYRVNRDTPKLVESVSVRGNHGYIVGAGVSTCAPLQ